MVFSPQSLPELAELNEIRSKSCFILDLDGVVYRGKSAIEGAVEAIQRLKQLGKNIAFITNNSAHSPVEIHKKLTGLGISCEPKDLLTCGHGLAFYLQSQKIDSGKGAFVIGTKALKGLIEEVGISLSPSDSCGAVVVGYDPEINYDKISKGLTALMRGVPFVVCNQDAHFPTEQGAFLPGCGAMVGALVGASLRQPTAVVGKPNVLMLQILLEKLSWKLEDCVMVGDTLDSDVLMAKNAGISSVWIVHSTPSLTQYPDLKPTLTVNGLSHLASLLLR